MTCTAGSRLRQRLFRGLHRNLCHRVLQHSCHHAVAFFGRLFTLCRNHLCGRELHFRQRQQPPHCRVRFALVLNQPGRVAGSERQGRVIAALDDIALGARPGAPSLGCNRVQCTGLSQLTLVSAPALLCCLTAPHAGMNICPQRYLYQSHIGSPHEAQVVPVRGPCTSANALTHAR